MVFETGSQGEISIDNIGKHNFYFLNRFPYPNILLFILDVLRFNNSVFVFYWTGPCSFDELFFPYASNSPTAFGTCHAIKFNGKSRYAETDNTCLNNYGKGSKRSSSSQRNVDYGLFMGALDFLHDRAESSR